jgi:hypothetical protein
MEPRQIKVSIIYQEQVFNNSICQYPVARWATIISHKGMDRANQCHIRCQLLAHHTPTTKDRIRAHINEQDLD